MNSVTLPQPKSNVSDKEIQEPLKQLQHNWGAKFCQPLWKRKYPTEKEWQNNPRTIEEIDLRTHGVGIIFGYGNLVGMDVDNQAGCDRFTRIFGCPPHEYESVSWASGKRFDKSYSPEITSTSNIQVLFVLADSQAEQMSKFKNDTGESSGYTFGGTKNELDVRWSGRQSVLPSLSPHPDMGKPYYWVNSPCEWDIAPIPEDAWERLLQEIEEDQKNRGYKSNNVNPNGDKQLPIPLDRKSPTFTDPIPLINCLSREHRDMIASGVQEGGRNEAGAALARDLIGASNKLSELNIPFSDCPESLFEEFCDRCTPPISPRERATIWRSAERGNPTPCLTDEMLENCVKSWHRQQNKVDAMRTPKEQREILERQISGKKTRKSDLDWDSEIAEIYRDSLAWDKTGKRWRRYLNGCWDEIDKEDIIRIISSELKLQRAEGGLSKVTSIEGLLRSSLYRNWDETPSLIPFADGVFDLKSNQLLPHSHVYNLTWKLPYNYNTTSTGWEKISDWLDFAVNGRQADKDILIAFAAATLRGRSDLQKFLFLQGVGGSGKSTFIQLLRDIVGAENECSSTLELWNTSRFESQKGMGKRIVIFEDEEEKVTKLAKFKMLTGGGQSVPYEIKGVSGKGGGYKYNGMVVVASNHYPFASGDISAIGRRKIEIRFSQRPKGGVRNLNKEFQAELPAFARYLLSLDNDWITRTLDPGTTGRLGMNAQSWESLCQNDAMAAWLDDWVIFDADAKTQIGGVQTINKELSQYDCTNLYESYCLFCSQDRRQPKSNRRFSEDLIRLLSSALGVEVKKIKTRESYKLLGLRLRTKSDADVPSHSDNLANEETQSTFTLAEVLENKTIEQPASADRRQTEISINSETSQPTQTAETQAQQEEKIDHRLDRSINASENQPTIAATTPSQKTNHPRPSRGFAKHNNLPDEREQWLLKVKKCQKAKGISDEAMERLIFKVYGDSVPLEKLSKAGLETLLEEMEHLVSERSIK